MSRRSFRLGGTAVISPTVDRREKIAAILGSGIDNSPSQRLPNDADAAVLEAAPRAKDSIVVRESWQDVEPILEHNKMLRSQQQRSDWAGTLQRYCFGSSRIRWHRLWLHREEDQRKRHPFSECALRSRNEPQSQYYGVNSGGRCAAVAIVDG